jgi:ribosomal protein S18 acetylase RimI-like enzyme
MYNNVSLSKKNIQEFLILNNRRKQFNILNEDLWEYYKDLSFTKQLILNRRVKLIKHSDDFVGYIWVSKYDKRSFIINSMYTYEEDEISRYKNLIESLKIKSNLLYNCEKSSNNYEILSKLGFLKKEGTYEMKVTISSINNEGLSPEVILEQFKKGKHEDVRCKIQNEVFKNDSRIPLTKEDIYYDEIQSYYFDKGSILLKKDDKYIGYGQIIFSDSTPTIVNVGLLKDYRSKGYGKTLMLHLLKILEEQGFKEVNLRVSTNNMPALKLYESLGFKIISEAHMWEYKK